MSDRVGPAGKVLAANISRIRKARKLTFAELSARTEEIGQPIPVLGLRRIERAERRVDYDDLLTLGLAIGVSPIDLMVPADTDVVPYPIGTREFGSRNTRRWICGGNLDPDLIFHGPIPVPSIEDLPALLGWLPEDRRERVLRDWLNERYRGEYGIGQDLP